MLARGRAVHGGLRGGSGRDQMGPHSRAANAPDDTRRESLCLGGSFLPLRRCGPPRLQAHLIRLDGRLAGSCRRPYAGPYAVGWRLMLRSRIAR